MENIYLVGFMGCGKTTLAKYLSKSWMMDYVDLDDAIVKKHKQSIPQLFEQKGETYFRQEETSILLESSDLRCTLIATGGGIVERSTNREFLKKQQVIYLKWPFEILYNRVKQDTKRPLATSYEELKARFDLRSSLYEEVACLVVDCEGQTLGSVSNLLADYYAKQSRIERSK